MMPNNSTNKDVASVATKLKLAMVVEVEGVVVVMVVIVTGKRLWSGRSTKWFILWHNRTRGRGVCRNIHAVDYGLRATGYGLRTTYFKHLEKGK